MKKIFCLSLILFAFIGVQPAMAAGPMLKFTPSSGSYDLNSTFKVTIGIDSGTEKTQAVDVWSTFDASKLKVVSIVKAATPAFDFAMGEANIDNTAGKFSVLFSPSAGSASFEATTVAGDLAVVTFETKSAGTAAVNFTCSSGSTIDSNIFNTATNDVINCALNQNGSYTISSSGGSTSGVTPTDAPVNTETTSSELPRTGSVGTTIALLVFAVVGVLSSFALKFL